ncbi:rho family-interacting cell polarization regulator 1-like isoform X2 [Lineus longissimus]|uniref:rho family-interacting cell polarization regulator 1-like isoform X2 n=1 Tax=Lineus longissimus TaxID=88925 RepID=UPI00315DCDA6
MVQGGNMVRDYEMDEGSTFGDDDCESYIMSLKEFNKPRPSQALNRSKSFTSQLNQGQKGGPELVEPDMEILSPILGVHGTGKGSTLAKSGHGMKKAPRIPKSPRPQRTQVMFESLRLGLKDFINATDEDIQTFKSEAKDQGSSSTELKKAERFKQKLEQQLAKVEELENDYILHQQLWEGVKTMARAFVHSPGNQRESLSHVKSGYKECMQTMCAIEAQLENMLGTFKCKIKGMVGFARLCPGDVFEVTIKHGRQKWRTKGKIGRNQTQHWDNSINTLKAVVGDILSIKAVECKGLGKSSILGQKCCETKELFSSHPQMMTISVNTNGSLKFSVIIAWDPLEGCDESFNAYTPTRKKHQAAQLHKANSSLRDEKEQERRRSLLFPLEDEDSPHSSQARSTRSLPAEQKRMQQPEQNAKRKTMADLRSESNHKDFHDSLNSNSVNSDMGPCSLSSRSTNSRPYSISSTATVDLATQKPRLFDMRMLADSIEDSSVSRQEYASLEEALQSLITVLEDYQGQYSELQKLEEQVAILDEMLASNVFEGNTGALDTQSADMSISIENALMAFDFLETEDAGIEDFDFANHTDSKYQGSRTPSLDRIDEHETTSPETNNRTSDSGIELANSHGDDHHSQSGSIASSSPESSTTNNSEVDSSLLYHLSYCERLLDSLGGFGPLKCREIYALEKLKTQSDIIEDLVKIAKKGPSVRDLGEVMLRLGATQQAQGFWLKCVDRNLLVTSPQKLLLQLEKVYGETISRKYDVQADKVLRGVIARILDIPAFDPDRYSNQAITLHQFMSFFNHEDRINMADYIEELAGEMWIIGRLKSGNADIVIKTILSFHKCLPPMECLKVLALLLISDNSELKETAESYLRSLGSNRVQRSKGMIVFVESLEDRNADVRCAACIALRILKARETIDQLVYIAETDNSHVVKARAKETLQSFGDEGTKALQTAELSSHGFQGLSMNRL